MERDTGKEEERKRNNLKNCFNMSFTHTLYIIMWVIEILLRNKYIYKQINIVYAQFIHRQVCKNSAKNNTCRNVKIWFMLIYYYECQHILYNINTNVVSLKSVLEIKVIKSQLIRIIFIIY